MTVNTRKHRITDTLEDLPESKRARGSSSSETADDEYAEATVENAPRLIVAPSEPRETSANDCAGPSALPNRQREESNSTSSVRASSAVRSSSAVAQRRTSKQGAIVDSSHLNFLTKEMEYIPEEFITRLLPMLNFVDVAANRFSIGLLPASMKWGPVGDGSGLDKYLCHADRALTVWMAGVVTSLWLTPVEGSRVSIGLRLLTDRDHDVARQIQFARCQPAGDPSKAGLTTFASRFLSSRGEHSTSSFEDIYDAIDVLGPWTSMDKLSPDSIQKTDIVLVECYVRRFKSKDGNSRQAWNSWGINFELLRIARLFAGPGPAELMPEESNISL